MKWVSAILLAVFVASPAQAAHWAVDYSKSRLGFSVPWQDQSFNGQFKSWKAAIDFDSADLAHAKVQVSVDLASVSSGEAETDANVKGPQGFDTARFTTAKFNASQFRAAGNGRYIAQGTLDLHGVTKPVAVAFTLQTKGNSTHMTGAADVVRTDFGIGMGEFAQDSPVGRKVTVKIDITATKQP
jgi:polyisoprenoid-binding protein YceI